MSEYIKRELAISSIVLECDHVTIEQARRAIKDVPLADVVEVVRCKDCKYWHEDRTNDEYFPEVHECTYPLDGDTMWTFQSEYCSNGERKDGEEE